jgi:uncharacterized protein YjbI with pentapeptide repeats
LGIKQYDFFKEMRRGEMYKNNGSRILALVCLISFAGFHTVVAYAGNESDRVKENIKALAKTKNCPGCDLTGAELVRMDLSGANLQGADLTGAKLFLTNLSGANLRDTHLQKTSFGGADLAGADLRGADLREVDLNGAYLTGTKLDSEPVSTKPHEDDLAGSEEKSNVADTVKSKRNNENQSAAVNGKRDVEDNATVVQKNSETGDHTSDMKDLSKTVSEKKSESDGIVPGGQVKEKVVQSTKTDEEAKETSVKKTTVMAENHDPAPKSTQDGKPQNMEQEKTRNEELPSVSPTDQGKGIVEKDPVSEKQVEKEKIKTTDVGKPAEISDDKAKNLKKLLETKKCYQCDLAGVDLSGKNLGKADLEGANLKGCNLENVDLAKANLKGASFVDANLKKADLKGADLYKANLSRADMTDARMEDAHVDETIFTGAIGRSM